MPELIEVLIDALVLAQEDAYAWLEHCASLETDYRFGWQERGKSARYELGKMQQHVSALVYYIEVLS